ncbi:hypothetical protein AA0242T_1254 [Acetobacter aceti NRIC 0242]|uniref:Uncharacterized protein n=2 Tax=Acetobacter aceti TaxID=435 RepID=A0A6S6PDA5_ACEAC|nr:hypothetical protein [Acetobacter aceti]GBO80552.1 hypothetical protein AA0242T_1254 [Acetobacter aceti NRIC 0242]TCS28380.1 hypothetical protein EDC15_12311 [Acetobacter aceti NBRC 14818]BCI65668.1 hypothetical protein AAJCM20276_02920 [Acetobacter aceti]BCK76343.1 hypothetical protein EMQ_1949 [Acetobacter aceti NBRC 14818]GAN58902.1 hypothetical protein Abac_107_011 [Acetobacter aceti NBRC 14818]
MSSLSRRSLLRAGLLASGAGAMASLTACTVTSSGGDTTYSVNVTKILSIISSIESGLTQMVNSTTVSSVIGTDNTAKITAAITKVSTVTAEVAAAAASSVTLTVAKNWIATAESAASAAITILQAFQSQLPTSVNTMVQAVATLLPALEALISSVSATVKTALSPAEAQTIIARGLQAS